MIETFRAVAVLMGFTVFALSVWLGVRVVNRREKWAKRAAVIAAICLVLYPPCFGPFAWIQRNQVLPIWLEMPLSWFYLPMFFLIDAPEPLGSAFNWYLSFWL